MTTLAQIFRVGPVEHDVLQTVGLLVAVVLLITFTSRHLRSGVSRRPGLLSALAIIGIASSLWSIVECVLRLYHALSG